MHVARSPSEQRRGLLDRRRLEAGRGMVFVVDPPRPVSMWMLDMSMPLDIVFVREGRVRRVVRRVPACHNLPCPEYDSRGPVDAVIEVGAGEARRLGLRGGVLLREPAGLLS